jgi:hypothetical protein
MNRIPAERRVIAGVVLLVIAIVILILVVVVALFGGSSHQPGTIQSPPNGSSGLPLQTNNLGTGPGLAGTPSGSGTH